LVLRDDGFDRAADFVGDPAEICAVVVNRDLDRCCRRYRVRLPKGQRDERGAHDRSACGGMVHKQRPRRRYEFTDAGEAQCRHIGAKLKHPSVGRQFYQSR
jgi:hypothetical protein